MEENNRTSPDAGPDQRAGDAAALLQGSAGPHLATMAMALQADVLDCFFYWCSPHVWGKWAFAGGPEQYEDVVIEEEHGAWPDVIENVAPDPLAHMPAGEFNFALHELQEQVCSGQFARDHPYELPPGYKPVLRPWPKDRETEPYEL